MYQHAHTGCCLQSYLRIGLDLPAPRILRINPLLTLLHPYPLRPPFLNLKLRLLRPLRNTIRNTLWQRITREPNPQILTPRMYHNDLTPIPLRFLFLRGRRILLCLVFAINHRWVGGGGDRGGIE